MKIRTTFHTKTVLCDKKIEKAIEPVKEQIATITEKLDCMYILNIKAKDSIEVPENLEIEVAETMERKLIWCTTLAEGLDIKSEKSKDFVEKVMRIVTKEEYEFKLILGTINGKPVSTTAFLRSLDDICGIYMSSVTENADKDRILGATLIKALKKVEEYKMYLSFINSDESTLDLYNKIGFVHSHYREQEKFSHSR